MIISASRRTDIPAFYADWFMGRIRAGFCRVVNPVNPRIVSEVSLLAADVDAIAFWSKYPAPLLPHVSELADRGFRFFFLFTVNDYPPALEPFVPPIERRLAVFGELAQRIGAERVIWRYDPIILSDRMDAARHVASFTRIATALHGATRRVIVSAIDFYRKTERRLAAVERATGETFCRTPDSDPQLAPLLAQMRTVAAAHGMQIRGCAESDAFAEAGIAPGACIDADYIREAFGLSVSARKDPGQRPLCRCAASRDIGSPDTCLHSCTYCYSTRSHEEAVRRHGALAPGSASLPGPRVAPENP